MSDPTVPEGTEQAADEAMTPGSDSLEDSFADGRNIDLLDSRPRAWRAYLHALGPGLVTGASDDDPSGIPTYAQTGARFGFGMLWVALITIPLMAGVAWVDLAIRADQITQSEPLQLVRQTA